MKSFKQDQICLITTLMGMNIDELTPIADKARKSGGTMSKMSKSDLIETILNRVGDEDEYPTRFNGESDDTKRQRKLDTIRALVNTGAANAHWFPILKEEPVTV
jgi:ribosomal protein L10